MSKGTEALDTAMQKHSANKDACQVANLNKNNADNDFTSSAQEVKDAIAGVQTEADQLASDASKQQVPASTTAVSQ